MKELTWQIPISGAASSSSDSISLKFVRGRKYAKAASTAYRVVLLVEDGHADGRHESVPGELVLARRLPLQIVRAER